MSSINLGQTPERRSMLPGLRCSEQASPHPAHWGQAAAAACGAGSTWLPSDTRWHSGVAGHQDSFRVSCSQPLLLPHAVRNSMCTVQPQCTQAIALPWAPVQMLIWRKKKDSLQQKKFNLIDMFCLEKGDVCSASHAVGLLGARPKCCWQIFLVIHTWISGQRTITQHAAALEESSLKSVPLQGSVHAPGQPRAWSCKQLTHQTDPHWGLLTSYTRQDWAFDIFFHRIVFCLLCIQMLLISSSAGAYVSW